MQNRLSKSNLLILICTIVLIIGACIVVNNYIIPKISRSVKISRTSTQNSYQSIKIVDGEKVEEKNNVSSSFEQNDGCSRNCP